MIHITNRVTIHATATQVWQMIRDFGGIIDWLPGIRGCRVSGQGVGAIRHITYTDGFQAEERLESVDEAHQSLRYTILTVTAFADACFIMSVQELNGHCCEFVWTCYFTPQGIPVTEAKALMANALAQGTVGLQLFFEQSVARV
ncbi:MAG: SRPBCC family protein [Caldilineaceae bacterium]